VSIRIALALGAGLPLIFISTAFAQAPAASPAAGTEATAERVIVTGSNIPTAEETGPNPVDTYRPEDMAKLGIRTTTDLTRNLPANSGGQINENIANGGDGRVEVNLRGIFPKETLVLVDGRRVAVSLFGGVLGGQSVDLNIIPFQAVDHIEILKDGASAIYGSDAISGVFNVMMKHVYHGLELGASYGNTNLGSANDAAEELGWMLAGTGDGKTEIVVFAEMYNRAAIRSRDVFLSSDPNYAAFGGFDARSSNFGGRIGSRMLDPSLIVPTPHFAANVSTDPQYVARTLAHGITPETKSFNFADLTDLIPAADREYLYGSFTRDICDKYLSIFSDFKFTRDFFDSTLAPVPFTPDPFLRPNGAQIGGAGISVPLQNPFNPFTVSNTVFTAPGGEPLYTGVKFRGLEEPVRKEKFTVNDYVYTVGLKGEMGEFGDYFKNWNWETGFRYDSISREAIAENEVSKIGLRQALLDTDPATAFNPFIENVYGTPGTKAQNTLAAKEQVYVTLHHNSTNTLALADAKLNGDLFNLPAGPVGFAVGAEHRTDRYRDVPDSLNTSFSTIGSTDLEASKGNRDVWSVFGEIRIPVTSPTWNFPGIYSLEFDIAERYEYFSDFGDSERPKFSVRYQPLDSAWTIRASYNEAFHVPYLNEVTPTRAETFPIIADPFHATAGNGPFPQIREIVSGNPLLKPEIAYEWSYGTVVTPGKWLSPLTGLTLSADWYHIDLRNPVSPFGAGFIVAHSNLFPGRVIRDGSPGPTDPSGNTGDITVLNDQTFNLYSVHEEGLDWEGIYQFETNRLGHGDWGTFTTTVNGTYLARYVFATQSPGNPGGKKIDETGTFADFGSLPQNRMYVSEYYDLGGLNAGATVHYIGQYQDSLAQKFSAGVADPLRKVREWVTLDLLTSYTFNLPAPAAQTEVAGYAKDGGKNVKMKDSKDKNVAPVSTAESNPYGLRWWLNGTTFTLGMNNVLDQAPPFVASAFESGYDESIASAQGRFWYVQLVKKF
jgi:iron complex outermembrane receptor protein